MFSGLSHWGDNRILPYWQESFKQRITLARDAELGPLLKFQVIIAIGGKVILT